MDDQRASKTIRVLTINVRMIPISTRLGNLDSMSIGMDGSGSGMTYCEIICER